VEEREKQRFAHGGERLQGIEDCLVALTKKVEELKKRENLGGY